RSIPSGSDWVSALVTLTIPLCKQDRLTLDDCHYIVGQFDHRSGSTRSGNAYAFDALVRQLPLILRHHPSGDGSNNPRPDRRMRLTDSRTVSSDAIIAA